MISCEIHPRLCGRTDAPKLVASQHADDHALNAASIGLNDSWLHSAVGRLKPHAAAFFVISLQRSLARIQQRHNLLAVARRFSALNDDVIPIAEMILDHGIAADFQNINATLGGEELFKIDLLAGFDRLNRLTGRDATQKRQFGRSLFIGKLAVSNNLQ